MFQPRLAPETRNLSRTTVVSSEDTLLHLIRNASTIRQVQSFLKARGLPSSAASWDALIDERIKPALREGLTEQDLLDLLSEAEEFGHQHIFLYQRRGRRTLTLPNENAITRWLKDTPDEELLDGPRLLEYPEVPTLSDVRLDDDGVLSLKVVETRTIVEMVSEHEQANGNFLREYSRTPIRAVNIVRLHSNGLLEVGIYSHRAQVRRYDQDVPAMWGLLAGLLEADDYAEWPLVKAKQALWEQRAALNGRIRFSKASLRDTAGTIMDCTSGSADSNIFDDAAAEAGLSTFHKRGSAYCDRHNLWWLEQSDGVPSRKVHVLLGGAPNEFAVTMQCSRSDYQHVLSELRQLNR